jgi:hypothetical protein
MMLEHDDHDVISEREAGMQVQAVLMRGHEASLQVCLSAACHSMQGSEASQTQAGGL